MDLPMPAIMGVLNVTPDSFSDGGEHIDPDEAVMYALSMLDSGAALIDVGGESTRPGAEPVEAGEEIARIEPVISLMHRARPEARISIDTSKLAVARAAVPAGARYINDVTAFRNDPEMAGYVADHALTCCLMHMQGEPRTMQDAPHYDDVVDDVKAFLIERLEFAIGQGVPEHDIHLDPGIGFGKTVEHNLELLRRLDEIVAIGRPIVVGASRKRFLGAITGQDENQRALSTAVVNALALTKGAHVFRVHDVAETAEALKVAGAVIGLSASDTV